MTRCPFMSDPKGALPALRAFEESARLVPQGVWLICSSFCRWFRVLVPLCAGALEDP